MMPVMSAHQTLLGLLSNLGEPVVKAIAAGAADMEGDAVRLIVVAITAAVQNLEGEPGDRLIASVLNGVDYTGDGEHSKAFELKAGDADFNSHFHGELLSVYKVWAWALEVNYRDFLDGYRGLGGDKAAGLVKQGLNSLLTPTSGSGQ